MRGPPPKRSRAAFCEVEIELEAGDPLRLFEFALALLGDLPLAVEPRSKAERGHALATGTAPRPALAQDVLLPEGGDAAGAIAAIVRNCLRQVEAGVLPILNPCFSPASFHTRPDTASLYIQGIYHG